MTGLGSHYLPQYCDVPYCFFKKCYGMILSDSNWNTIECQVNLKRKYQIYFKVFLTSWFCC